MLKGSLKSSLSTLIGSGPTYTPKYVDPIKCVLSQTTRNLAMGPLRANVHPHSMIASTTSTYIIGRDHMNIVVFITQLIVTSLVPLEPKYDRLGIHHTSSYYRLLSHLPRCIIHTLSTMAFSKRIRKILFGLLIV